MLDLVLGVGFMLYPVEHPNWVSSSRCFISYYFYGSRSKAGMLNGLPILQDETACPERRGRPLAAIHGIESFRRIYRKKRRHKSVASWPSFPMQCGGAQFGWSVVVERSQKIAGCSRRSSPPFLPRSPTSLESKPFVVKLSFQNIGCYNCP